MKKDDLIKRLKAQLACKNKDERLSKKLGNIQSLFLVKYGILDNLEISKNASISNFSMINQSISLAKKNEAAGQAGQISEYSSRNGTLRLEKMESTDIDTTAENILFGINSPRVMKSVQTCRNGSSTKRDFDFTSVYSNINHKRDNKSMFNIQLNENSELDGIKAHGFGDNLSSARSNQCKNDIISQHQSLLNGYGGFHSRSTSNTLELKKKNGLVAQAEKMSMMNNPNLLADSMKYISYLECDLCKDNYGMTEFLDHISMCAQGNQDKVYKKLNQNPSYANIFNSPDHRSSSLFDISAIRHKPSISSFGNHLQTKQYEEKIKELEEKLKESQQNNERLNIEKDRIQVELDRVILELKQIKMELALSEEKKEEIELALKNEIKFLINTILQTQQGGNPNASRFDVSASALRITKSTGENLSFINNSGFLNYSNNNPNLSIINQSNYVGQIYDHHTLKIISNNIVDNIKDRKAYKKSNFSEETTTKETIQGNKRYPDNSGNKLNFDKDETNCGGNCGDSPRKVSELYTNENSLLHNISHTARHPKKLMKNLKA